VRGKTESHSLPFNRAGITDRRVGLTTVDLLIKVAYFVKKNTKIFSIEKGLI
jgi:hypothetical protein